MLRYLQHSRPQNELVIYPYTQNGEEGQALGSDFSHESAKSTLVGEEAIQTLAQPSYGESRPA
jgi:hypothetical protein